MNWNRKSLGARIVHKVVEIMEELNEYLPMTLRQIHYQLVARTIPGYANTQNKYKQLSDWLYDARVDGLIPWDSMIDRARQFLDYSGYINQHEYLNAKLLKTMYGYDRDLMQTQKERLEVWTEKDALASVLGRFASDYCVSVEPCRGFGSGSQFHKVVNRHNEKTLRILYFGDHDPSGMWMSEMDIEQRLQEKHGIDVRMERIGLNIGQVHEYGLDESWQTPKLSDSRSRWYIKNYGTKCWELDALSPPVLGELVRKAIEDRTDMDLFREEQEREKQDRSEIEDIVDGWWEQI